MPFELRDFQDLLRLLREHPDWREELRALLLTQELLTLPLLVRELAEAVARLTERQAQLTVRVEQLAETVAELAEGQRRLTERQEQLTARVEQLTETVGELVEGQRRLTGQQAQLTETVGELVEGQRRLTGQQAQLTETVGELVEGQRRLTGQQAQLTETVGELVEGQRRLTGQQAQLTETVGELVEGQRRLTGQQAQLTETVGELVEGQRRLTGQQAQLTEVVARLAEGQERLVIQMGEVRGWALEQRYHTQAPAYFGRFLRRVQPVDVGRFADALKDRLAEGELAEVLLADLILTGRLSTPSGLQTIWVVLEVSATVDRGDVERAQRRATVLRQARYPAVAVAAGMEATAGARQAARDAGVALLFDGRIDGWQEALDRRLAEGEAGSA